MKEDPFCIARKPPDANWGTSLSDRSATLRSKAVRAREAVMDLQFPVLDRFTATALDLDSRANSESRWIYRLKQITNSLKINEVDSCTGPSAHSLSVSS